MPTLYLIDAFHQFFRNYHAIRTPMTSPVTREPTNMTFGFVGMLLKLLKADPAATPNLIKSGRPDFVVFALDVSGDRGTFRSELYPPYKAQRPPPPEDLRPQVDRCMEILRAVGIPAVGAEGFEADDVIATLVTRLRAKHPDLQIRIASKDKDLKQLLGPGVAMFDIQSDTAYDAANLKDELGIEPAKVIDLLSLMGDTVDNVPGIKGVGEKTAAELVREFGSVDAVIARAGEIRGKRGENVRAAAEMLPLSRRLVTLRHDVPIRFELDEAQVAKLSLERLIPICKELGFNRYQDDVRALTGSTAPTGRGSDPASIAGSGTRASPRGPAAKPVRDEAAGTLFAPGLFAPSEERPRPIAAQSGVYTCITDAAALQRVIDELAAAPVFAVDTETTSLVPHDAKLCGISLSTAPGTGYYIPVRSPTPDQHLGEAEVLSALRGLLEDAAKPKCGHNLKYDLMIFRAHGVTLRGFRAEGACDSMIASYLIDASRSSHGLDSLALALLERTNISITELIGTGKAQRTFDTVPIEQATEYAAEDADVAIQLRERMMPQLRAMELMPLFHDVEMPLVEVLAELEWNGVLVEPGELDRQRVRLQTQIDAIAAQIDAAALESMGRTFDPDSPRQLAAALFNAPADDTPGLGIKGAKRTKTGFSTDAEVLESLAEDPAVTTPLPRLILEYRQLTKLVSTYLVALKEAIHPVTKRVHSSFNQTVAATGRLASSDPNLQNIPIRTEIGRDIRRAFIAPPEHVLVSADYSQIELRLLACLSEDPALIEAFAQGEDIHTAVAAQIHGVAVKDVTREQRSGAKMVNFGIVYGITPFGLARRLKIDTPKAAEIIDGYKRRFAGITTFLQECIEQARAKGYVTTMLGRRRPIPDIDSTNPSRRALAERLAINSVVQGSAADLIKLAMVNIYTELTQDPARAGVRMILQIHDELVFEAPESKAEATMAFVTDRMEHAMKLRVPLKADARFGKNWFEGK